MKIRLATLALLAATLPALAGNLDAPALPASGSGMPTTAAIYNRLSSGAAISVPGAFQEPGAGPTAGTGRTLADIAAKLPVPDNTQGAAAGDVASGKTFWGLRTDGTWGPRTGTQAAPASGTNVTGANGQLTFTIPDGLYSGGKTATAIDGNLQPGNIRSGTTIFGVSGNPNVVDTTATTTGASAGDIALGKTAYVNGALVTGTLVAVSLSHVTCAAPWTGTTCDVCRWAGVNCDTLVKPFPSTMPSYATSPWKCVTDTATGLTWEVKTTDGGLHDQNHTYTWYDSTFLSQPGTQNGGTCNGSGCDTEKFVAAVNAEGLCGFTNWRLPSRSELLELTSGGLSAPFIDTAYFPNTLPECYWTGNSVVPISPDTAWNVCFDGTREHGMFKWRTYHVRLVRSGP